MANVPVVPVPLFLAGIIVTLVTVVIGALLAGVFKLKHDKDAARSALALEKEKALHSSSLEKEKARLSFNSAITQKLIENQLSSTPVIIENIIATWRKGITVYSSCTKLERGDPVMDFNGMDDQTRDSFLLFNVENDVLRNAIVSSGYDVELTNRTLLNVRARAFYEAAKGLDDMFIKHSAFLHPDIYEEALHLKDRMVSLSLMLVQIASEYDRTAIGGAVVRWVQEGKDLMPRIYTLITSYHKAIWPPAH
jgi:hypothetical protein